ncbi:MAG TPA: hypothetical protein VF746_19890 [Longimicrobium sp.]|jgi:hypothetical protein
MKRSEESVHHGGEDFISLRALRMIDTAVANLRRGIVGEPLDPEQVRRLAGLSGMHTLDSSQPDD